MDFNVTAQEIMVVVSPEPTSLTDAYALMKVLSLKYAEKNCKLLVNQAGSVQEALDIYRQLDMVVRKFLDISIDYVGCVLYDDRVRQRAPAAENRDRNLPGLQGQSLLCRLGQAYRQHADVKTAVWRFQLLLGPSEQEQAGLAHIFH